MHINVFDKSITVDGVLIYLSDPPEKIAIRMETIVRNVRAHAKEEVRIELRKLLGAAKG